MMQLQPRRVPSGIFKDARCLFLTARQWRIAGGPLIIWLLSISIFHLPEDTIFWMALGLGIPVTIICLMIEAGTPVEERVIGFFRHRLLGKRRIQSWIKQPYALPTIKTRRRRRSIATSKS